MPILLVGLVNVLGGLFYGVPSAIAPVYLYFDTMSRNCTQFEDEAACHSSKSGCQWVVNSSIPDSPESSCAFIDDHHCSAMNTSQQCADATGCFYDYDAKLCTQSVGMSAIQTGVYVAAMMIGGALGCALVGISLERLGRRKTIILFAFVGVVSAILSMVARHIDSYALLIVSRIFIGFVVGGMTVTCPLYVGENTPASHPLRGILGFLFQIVLTFGIVLMALAGYVATPRKYTGALHLEARIQGILAVNVVVCVLLMALGFFLKESRTTDDREPLMSDSSTGYGAPHESDVINFPHDAQKDVPQRFNAKALLGALFLAASLQLTGINAIMNYAPRITKSIGMAPMLGNLVVMVWNFVTTLFSIPIVSRVSARKLYLGGVLAVTCGCIMTAIASMPGVADETARAAVSAAGIAVFILAFEVGVGPPFYVLATEIFPASLRDRGCMLTQLIQFGFVVAINFGFPVTVESLSGGPSGNQYKGLSIVFWIFAAFGVVCLLVLAKVLPKSNP